MCCETMMSLMLHNRQAFIHPNLPDECGRLRCVPFAHCSITLPHSSSLFLTSLIATRAISVGMSVVL